MCVEDKSTDNATKRTVKISSIGSGYLDKCRRFMNDVKRAIFLCQSIESAVGIIVGF